MFFFLKLCPFLERVFFIYQKILDCVLHIWILTCGDLLYSVIFFSNDYFSFLLFSVGDFLKVLHWKLTLSAAAVVFLFISFVILSSPLHIFYSRVHFGSLPYCIPPLSIHGFPAFLSWSSGQKDHGLSAFLHCVP